MRRRRMLAAVTGAVVVVAGLYMMMRAKPEPAKASTPFKPHALTGLSDQEKAQYALDYVQANFTNYVPPRLRFARTLTSAQMYDLGLGQPVGAAVERQIPMFTVMLQGDFGMAKPGCGASAPGAERIAGKTFKFLQLSFADDEGLVATLVANPDGRGLGKCPPRSQPPALSWATASDGGCHQMG